jgi:hypothetical protein
MSYQITFENTLSKAVQLQVNAGDKVDCNANGQVVNEQLDAYKTKTIDTDENIVCYRRTADPDNPGQMTAWVTFSPDDQNTPALIDVGLL